MKKMPAVYDGWSRSTTAASGRPLWWLQPLSLFILAWGSQARPIPRPGFTVFPV